MLEIIWGAIVFSLWWTAFVFFFAMLSGCGYLVADNPACLQHCSSAYEASAGGVN